MERSILSRYKTVTLLTSSPSTFVESCRSFYSFTVAILSLGPNGLGFPLILKGYLLTQWNMVVVNDQDWN